MADLSGIAAQITASTGTFACVPGPGNPDRTRPAALYMIRR